MLNMREWKSIDLDVVDEVLLDPRNIRIAGMSGVNQADLVQMLFLSAKVMDLVDSIARISYLEHEIPIVVNRNDRWFVVEGNRRLAALKVIQNPYLVPSFTSKIRNASEEIENRDLLKRIAFRVAPSQSEADQLIAAIHTSNPRVAWGPEKQIAFFQMQMDSGKSVQDLRKDFPTIDLNQFLQRRSLIELLGNIEGLSEDSKKLLNSQSSWVSTLARLYPNKGFREVAGLAINHDQSEFDVTNERRFSEVGAKVLEDIRKGRINTRILNKVSSADYKSYIKELESESAFAESDKNKDEKESSDHRSGNSSDANLKANHKSPAPGASAKKPVSNRLVVSDIQRPITYPALVDHISEIERIDFSKFPNATIALMRSLVEKSIKALADAKNRDIQIDLNLKVKNVQLANCLDWLTMFLGEEDTAARRSLKQITQQMRSSPFVEPGTLNSLNASLHNHFLSLAPDEVKISWTRVYPVVKYISAEITP